MSIQTSRARSLAANLRQLRRDAERFASAATIHCLSNDVLTIEAALHVVEKRLGQGPSDEVEQLLDLAESRLSEGRLLLVWPRKRYLTRACIAMAHS
jgi:hypothetical protein